MTTKIADKDIATIAETILSAAKDGETGRVTYLRALIAATQDELGKRGQEAKVQLAALAAIHERFYAIVLEAAQPFVPKTQKDRPVELHRRVNFARTAVSALRGHVRAGGDIAALSPAKATKRGLMKRSGPPRALTPKRWKARTVSQAKTLLETLVELAKSDKGTAIMEMQALVGVLTVRMMKMGMVATKSPALALAEHRPLSVGRAVFMPASGRQATDSLPAP